MRLASRGFPASVTGPRLRNLPLPMTLSTSFGSPHIDQKVAGLLEQMTLEEKIGQLVQFSSGNATGPDNAKVDQAELAAQGGIGSVLNLVGARETNALQRCAMEKSRLGIPILFSRDIIHGFRTIYPIPLAMSATWDADIAEQCARMAAVEGTAHGIRWTFSPMMDIARDARWGRISEGNGEDPWLGQVLAAAWVRGYQGQDLSDPLSMVACAKHFVAYGGAEGGRDYNTVDVSDRVLREIYLPPFKAAIDAGVGTFMSAFNTVQSVPASADVRMLTGVLRDEWGFQGFVVSDWNSIGELIPHGYALKGEDAALKALIAGVDMDMQSNLYITKLSGLVESGRLKVEVIDEAVRRVLRIKFALGLFENPYTDESREAAVTLKPEWLALAQKAAEESFVLLKNEGAGDGKPVLPLQSGQTVALIGALADSAKDMLGSWALSGVPGDVTTLRQSLESRLGDKLIYARGVGVHEEGTDGIAAAVEAATRADVVVIALGETSDMSGEATSRTRLSLPGKQLELLQAVVATGKPVVLVLFNGRPLTIPWEAEHVPAILEAWLPGTQAGPALVRALYGEYNTSGKLTATFPRTVGQVPLYYNCERTGRPRPGGDRFITGYIDESHLPLYPFGWGLSYTSFEYSPTRFSSEAEVRVSDLNHGGSIQVEATVKNTGSREGAEVAQCYIGLRGTSVVRPVRELKGFQKVLLQPGESRKVTFSLTSKELAFWNIDMQFIAEPCELTVWIAPHAQAGEPAKMIIEA
ncbi:MAG TPA: glycoside hydrolase family 3 N-terminal domain-containing protein [Candidatus Methylacidiphilales bacterium]|nr:glycoside hydrolase family 3 N-terminal domain-containing protein [Candidatus Methylacidiphilales bacterium]